MKSRKESAMYLPQADVIVYTPQEMVDLACEVTGYKYKLNKLRKNVFDNILAAAKEGKFVTYTILSNVSDQEMIQAIQTELNELGYRTNYEPNYKQLMITWF